MLPFWDMLFGTHIDPLKADVRAMGIEGDPIPHKFVTEIFWPIASRDRAGE